LQSLFGEALVARVTLPTRLDSEREEEDTSISKSALGLQVEVLHFPPFKR